MPWRSSARAAAAQPPPPCSCQAGAWFGAARWLGPVCFSPAFAGIKQAQSGTKFVTMLLWSDQMQRLVGVSLL